MNIKILWHKMLFFGYLKDRLGLAFSLMGLGCGQYRRLNFVFLHAVSFQLLQKDLATKEQALKDAAHAIRKVSIL